jgi:hypothetical protein
MHSRIRRPLIASVAWLIMSSARTQAQELEPRAYSPSPTGVNFVVTAFGRSTGSVLTDPSLPVENVTARLNAGAIGYGHTFGLLGRSASAALVMPYVWGDMSGSVGGQDRAITRSGLADVKLRLAVNLIGGPALSPREFAQRTPATTLGVSLSISAPTGQYDPDKLINIGTNRWAFKPEIGLSKPLGKWFLEAYTGVTLFTDNHDFYGGQLRQQDPIWSLQAHACYTFRPRLWLAANATFYEGGESVLNGVGKNDRVSNSRAGFTMSLPVGKLQSLKLSWSRGATTRIGSSFTSWGIGWQATWFDRKR